MTNLIAFFSLTLALSSMALALDSIVLFSENDLQLKAEYGKITSNASLKLSFYEDCVNEDSSICLKKYKANQYYTRFFSSSSKQECLNYEQTAIAMNDILQFCVELGNSAWYGGAETTYQHWPLNKLNWTDMPYVTKEADSQAIIESYFFNSHGFYIRIDDSVALFVDINGPRPGQMCFAAKVTGPYRKNNNFMKFSVCKYKNPREAHENAVKDVLGLPASIPDPYVVKYPIWSTWARYKVDVNTLNVKSYAEEIVRNGFPLGTLEIDDNWETCYGSAEFNTSRFENIKGLTTYLKSIGFKTSLWTHPFINLDCDMHKEANGLGYFVKSTRHTVESVWWNGKASYIDYTNPEAAAWWSNRLRSMLATSGIDTLKFDAGEFSWTPQLPEFYDNDLTYYPDNIVNAYLKTIVAFGDGIEYRSSRRSQEFGRFLRMIDRESRWDFKLGLPTLITSLLHMNMIGYPFVLPDMIGGNGYNNAPPSKEMYIRWMQANTFMPAVQFSYTPWEFDQQTVDICRSCMNIRSNYTDTIVQLMRNSVSNGSPVNPPIWWIDPTDETAHYIDDEYLLGEDVLVAPVITEKAVNRNIYLPCGLWRDENDPNAPLIEGRKWLYNYPAPLNVLPWFTKVKQSSPSSPSSPTSGSNTHVSAIGYTVVLSLIAYLIR